MKLAVFPPHAHPRPVDPAARARAAAVLTKATVRAGQRLGLTQADVGATIGVSPATVSRMVQGTWTLSEGSKAWELAALLVRVFRSLDAFVGGNEQHVQAWFAAHNDHLGGVPATLVLKVGGLIHVAEYLDAVRGAQ